MTDQRDFFSTPILCRIWHRDELVREFTPTQADQLRTRIVISALGSEVWGDFNSAFVQFVSGGARNERYACVACKTIEKFGEAIQFREDFIVEFLRLG